MTQYDLQLQFCRRNNDETQYEQECLSSGKVNFGNNGHNGGAGEYQQHLQGGEREVARRDDGNGSKYGARPKVYFSTYIVKFIVIQIFLYSKDIVKTKSFKSQSNLTSANKVHSIRQP